MSLTILCKPYKKAVQNNTYDDALSKSASLGSNPRGRFVFVIPQALIAELRMLDSKINEYKSENQRLADELANTKKKYLSQKRLHR